MDLTLHVRWKNLTVHRTETHAGGGRVEVMQLLKVFRVTQRHNAYMYEAEAVS